MKKSNRPNDLTFTDDEIQQILNTAGVMNGSKKEKSAAIKAARIKAIKIRNEREKRDRIAKAAREKREQEPEGQTTSWQPNTAPFRRGR